MTYSLDPISDNCYPDTTVLVNKLNIRDEILLGEVEATLVTSKTVLWENDHRQKTFNFAHYRAIHQFLFEDLYDWAGQIRTVDISKKGTRFCSVKDIEDLATRIFTGLHNRKLFTKMDRREFLSEIVEFYCNTNQLHPFREGNGRTQRIFNKGYSLLSSSTMQGTVILISQMLMATC